MNANIEQNLKKENILFPEVAAPVANYVGWTLCGKTLYVSGQLPTEKGAVVYKGRLGESLSVEEGCAAARLCAVNLLAQLKNACSVLAPEKGLNAVVKVLKLEGLVSATPDFTDHPKVINGASDLMVSVLEEAGKHSRVAYGVASLPLGAAVEVAGIFELDV